MKHSLALSVCIAASLAACRSLPSDSEAALLAADRAFCADTQARRIDGWLAAFDEHGSQVAEDFQPLTGSAAIRANMQDFFADPRNELLWEPDAVQISEAGNLGQTTGRFTLRRRRADGSVEQESHGRYFDVWRKLQDGQWKLLYDLGEADPAPTK